MYRSQSISQIDMKAELRPNPSSTSLSNPTLFNSHQNPLSVALKGCLGNLDGACIEKLLLHCANALENSDINSAQQVMWVLNNVASSSGDPNQRLASWFLRALVSRASRVCPTPMSFNGGRSAFQRRLMSVTQLAGYVDLIPWYRFGFCASNSAIFKAIQGCSKVHILDFSITHCMQWPTLIDALAKRPEGPPSLRISVPSWRPSVPPFVNVLAEEVGLRLTNFANFRNVPFEFNVIEVSPSLEESSINFNYEFLLTQTNLVQDDEELVINCQNWLRYMPDTSLSKDSFLELIKSLNPRILTIVDEDSDLGSSSLASRITTCFNFLWIPFDALETFLPKDSSQRMEYEADIGHKIENIIGFEGRQRIERLESGAKLSQRMKNLGFFSVPYGEDTLSEVKFLLDEHASGWGMKTEDDMIVLTWKGHNSVYATAWFSYGFEDQLMEHAEPKNSALDTIRTPY
ncbi:putative transcription factor GRAS family [Helianthus annuus]|nr:putative transcription factor GRAS family [Helianthus annuus]KAJ0658721.1 putative transcription factor GRAS family [Helianthus annuus]KAJ0702396.1 putative transcription factor GRAS family [Helianthus annuus]KAJ0852233.1 putative transcription factor GRAS family [Helianthus annuus]